MTNCKKRGPRPELNLTWIKEYQIDHRELQRLIEWYFGFEYDVLFAIGAPAGQGQNVAYTVSGVLDVRNEAVKRGVRRLRHGNRTRNLQFILDVLVADGQLKSGIYVVNTGCLHPIAGDYVRLLKDYRDTEHPKCIAMRTHYHGTNVGRDIANVDERWQNRFVTLDGE